MPTQGQGNASLLCHLFSGVFKVGWPFILPLEKAVMWSVMQKTIEKKLASD